MKHVLKGAVIGGPALGVAWRFALIWGLAAGLALAPALGSPASWPVVAIAVPAIALVRPGRNSAPSTRIECGAWLAAVACIAALAGAAAGSARIEARDASALSVDPGAVNGLEGFVSSSPELGDGSLSFPLATGAGRILITGAPITLGLRQGDEVVVSGAVSLPEPWLAGALGRQAITRVVSASSVVVTGARRGGIAGLIDTLRRRSEDALTAAGGEASALLEGFVLGRDDLISDEVSDEFRRAGLAHILAVSGQNIVLLVLLATPILALAGVPLRWRLWLLIALVAIYVPVAGGGPSIQRAGVMGVAGLVAGLAARPRDRWYALGLAAAATLALEPRATADIGWQLSFAAVAGILVLAAPLVRLLGGVDPAVSPVRRALCEAVALTVAASLATIPIAAHTFGTVSLTVLPANVLAIPAVAPAMWLGMLAAALGQIPVLPAEPVAALGGICAGFIGWVASILGRDWAQAEVAEISWPLTLIGTTALVGGARLALRVAERRRGLRPISMPSRRSLAGVLCGAGLGGLVFALAVLVAGGFGAKAPALEDRPVLRVDVIDVGQGDAILVRPPGEPGILIDTGPPGGDIAAKLAELGAGELAAAALTHDDLDHSGALAELLGDVVVPRLLVTPGLVPKACAAVECPPIEEVAAGSGLRLGDARISVLWPPPGMTPSVSEPNATSMVAMLRFHDFSMLLTGDAESELAPVDPGPVDVLKVAHHGSDDAGLPALLQRVHPALALISVGAGNTYGHPTGETLDELADAGATVARTDLAGSLAVEAWPGGYRLLTGD